MHGVESASKRFKAVDRAQWEREAWMAQEEEEGSSSSEDYATAAQIEVVATDGDVAVVEVVGEQDQGDDLALFSASHADRVRARTVKREWQPRQRPRTLEAFRSVCVDGRSLVEKANTTTTLVDWQGALASLPAVGCVIPFPGESPPSPDRVDQWTTQPIVYPAQHRRWKLVEEAPPPPPELSSRTLRRHPGLGRKRERLLAKAASQPTVLRAVPVEPAPLTVVADLSLLLPRRVDEALGLATSSSGPVDVITTTTSHKKKKPKNFLF